MAEVELAAQSMFGHPKKFPYRLEPAPFRKSLRNRSRFGCRCEQLLYDDRRAGALPHFVTGYIAGQLDQFEA